MLYFPLNLSRGRGEKGMERGNVYACTKRGNPPKEEEEESAISCLKVINNGFLVFPFLCTHSAPFYPAFSLEEIQKWGRLLVSFFSSSVPRISGGI